jgi:hypothetical protein
MITQIIDFVQFRFRIFWYNFGWSDYTRYIDGWLPKFSLFVPIIGYLIVFSDQLGGALNQFTHLLKPETNFGISGNTRLRLIYFGLFFLGASNLIYILKKPYHFRFGTNRVEFSKTALEAFTFQDFLSLHQIIRKGDPLTTDGKYYDSEWRGFQEHATNRGEGTENVERTGHWEDAKNKYGSLLKSILAETFFRSNSEGKKWLVLCIFLSTIGYLLLAIPGVDMFIKVFVSSI